MGTVRDASGGADRRQGSAGEDDLIRRVGEELDRRLNVNSSPRDDRGLLGLRRGLKTRHRVLHVALAFFGSTLCWYALWKVVGTVPILRNPIVALVAVVALLGVTAGYRKTLL